MNTSPPLLSFEHVSCVYSLRSSMFTRKKFSALTDVSFSLYPGETLGVIGKNGAGKSTILRLLSGIIAPTSGRIQRQAGLSVSLLSLQVGFDSELSGRDNIALSGLLLGFSMREIRRLEDGIIDFAALGEYIESPIKTYSTGMRARLGFAIAVHLTPDVLLIDEVLGVGDIEFRKKAVSAIKAKVISNQTVVLVSHDMNTLRSLSDRVVWIEDGVTIMEGVAGEVIDKYLAERT